MENLTDHRILGLRASFSCIAEMFEIDAKYYDRHKKVIGRIDLTTQDLYLPVEFLIAAKENLHISVEQGYFKDDDSFILNSMQSILHSLNVFKSSQVQGIEDSEYRTKLHYQCLKFTETLLKVYPFIVNDNYSTIAKILCHSHRTDQYMIENILRKDDCGKLYACLLEEMVEHRANNISSTEQVEYLNMLDQVVFDYYNYELGRRAHIEDSDARRRVVLKTYALQCDSDKDIDTPPIKTLSCMLQYQDLLDFRGNLKEHVLTQYGNDWNKIETLSSATGIRRVEAARILEISSPVFDNNFIKQEYGV